MSSPMRGFAAALSLVCTWILAMVLEALRAPAWLLALTAAVILLSLIAVTAAIHAATCDQPGDDPGDGHDGRGRPGPANPGRDGGGGDEPEWWPEFERQFAGYVSAVERRRRSAAPSA